MDEKIEASTQCNVVKTGTRNEVLTVYRCVVRYVIRHQKIRKFLAKKIGGLH